MVGARGPRLEVLVMGPQGSGKTVLCRRMKQACKVRAPDDILDTMPTLGVELDDVMYNKCNLVLREVGGSFVQVWKNFYADCGAWLFVLDLSDHARLGEAAVELINVARDNEMKGKPVLLVLNKTDADATIRRHELDSIMRLSELRDSMPKLQVVEASGLKGSGVTEILNLLAAICSGKPISS